MSRQVTILVAFFLSACLFGSIAAFLLYVPAISWISVSVVLLGMILMFLLGVQTGSRKIRIARFHLPGARKPAEWLPLKRADRIAN